MPAARDRYTGPFSGPSRATAPLSVCLGVRTTTVALNDV